MAETKSTREVAVAEALGLAEVVPQRYAAEPPCTVAEFLASRPDMRDRVAKLGIWSRSLKELGDA